MTTSGAMLKISPAAMPLLHDQAVRSRIERRLQALTPDTRPRWGKMSVDQMLWHLNQAIAGALGEIQVTPLEKKPPLPGWLMKFLVINAPWGKGAPTMPGFVAKGSYDFEAERTRSIRLLQAFVAKPIESEWPRNALFGAVTGRDVSRLHAKHFDHHLRQFGV